MKTTITINGNTITCEESLVPAIIAQMCSNSPAPTPAPAPAPAPARKSKTTPKPARKSRIKVITPADARGHQWWDDFKSDNTTVTLLKDTVQVKVARGHADEWHDSLRHAGFKWSKKGFWWAYLDSKKRNEIAERNRANDAATAGMSKEERRAYWRERNASRVA